MTNDSILFRFRFCRFVVFFCQCVFSKCKWFFSRVILKSENPFWYCRTTLNQFRYGAVLLFCVWIQGWVRELQDKVLMTPETTFAAPDNDKCKATSDGVLNVLFFLYFLRLVTLSWCYCCLCFAFLLRRICHSSPAGVSANDLRVSNESSVVWWRIEEMNSDWICRKKHAYWPTFKKKQTKKKTKHQFMVIVKNFPWRHQWRKRQKCWGFRNFAQPSVFPVSTTVFSTRDHRAVLDFYFHSFCLRGVFRAQQRLNVELQFCDREKIVNDERPATVLVQIVIFRPREWSSLLLSCTRCRHCRTDHSTGVMVWRAVCGVLHPVTWHYGLYAD